MSWTLYLLRCSDGTLYAGITTDLSRRLRQHNGEEPGGARYTAGRRPVRLAWSEAHADRSSASRREREVKKLRKREKESLAAPKARFRRRPPGRTPGETPSG